MSRIQVDYERCVGSGSCEALAPDVFEVGDRGVVEVRQPEPDERVLPDVRAAVAACPTRALSLAD